MFVAGWQRARVGCITHASCGHVQRSFTLEEKRSEVDHAEKVEDHCLREMNDVIEDMHAVIAIVIIRQSVLNALEKERPTSRPSGVCIAASNARNSVARRRMGSCAEAFCAHHISRRVNQACRSRTCANRTRALRTAFVRRQTRIAAVLSRCRVVASFVRTARIHMHTVLVKC